MSARKYLSRALAAHACAFVAGLAFVAALAVAAPASAATECGQDYYDGLRSYDAGNKDAAIQIWQTSGLAGDVRSQFRLGEIYENGDHVLINYVEAHKWYNLAANNDLQHCSGDFGSKEALLARDHAKEARDRLEDLMTNRAITDAHDEVVDIYECKSDGRSLYELGRMFQSGTGLPQSSIDACRYFAIAASRGVAEAKDALSVLNGVLSPDQIDNCQRAAIAWQRPTADICTRSMGGAACPGASQVPWPNRQAALKALGYYHDVIDGSVGPRTRDAIRDFQRDISSQATGTLSDSQICSLIEKAASNGDGISQATLGEMYYSGIGKSKNYDSARDWLDQAADRGVPSALYRLGTMYVEGVGVERDFYKGCQYLRQADSLGHPDAGREIGRYCTQ